jgi:DNA-directed RNA polymerase specialized sigma24 family protein
MSQPPHQPHHPATQTPPAASRRGGPKGAASQQPVPASDYWNPAEPRRPTDPYRGQWRGGGQGSTRSRFLARDDSKHLVALAQYLPPEDASLVQAVFGDGTPITQVALLLNRPLRALSRRIHRLEMRLRDPAFHYCVRCFRSFDEERQNVVRMTIFEGVSLRIAAERMGVSMHVVRTHRLAVEAEALAILDRVTAPPGSRDVPIKPSDLQLGTLGSDAPDGEDRAD